MLRWAPLKACCCLALENLRSSVRAGQRIFPHPAHLTLQLEVSSSAAERPGRGHDIEQRITGASAAWLRVAVHTLAGSYRFRHEMRGLSRGRRSMRAATKIQRC